MKIHRSVQTRQIKTIPHPLNAGVKVPGSKSLTNRALLIAALAVGTTELTNALFSDDTCYFVKALQTLGVNITQDPQNTCMTITGLGGSFPAQQADIYIGNAGTAARFLSAFLTLGNGSYTLDGDSRMRKRPIGDLINALKQLGANVDVINNYQSSICLPIKISASGLPGGKTKITGNISSQFLSALLMTAPYANTPVQIKITTELNSKPYVDMTLAVMAEFGIEVEHYDYSSFQVHPSRYSSHSTYSIESDISSASYFFAAPAICGGSLTVKNINRRSKQGDIQFLDILAKMGCVIKEHENSIEVIGAAELIGLDVNMQDFSDTAQTLAVVAPFATTPTRIRGISSARLKETDRISAVCSELQRIGVCVTEHSDGMTIYPSSEIHDALVQTYNDHRMAMAFSLIGLRVPGIMINDPGCVSKTFPDFYNVLETLR